MAIDTVINQYGGEILATGVSFEEYLVRFDGMHCELVDGNVIKMSPVSLEHQDLQLYLILLFSTYFDLRPIGKIVSQPFVQRLLLVDSKREPDLLVILNENLARLKPTYLDGAADICIEIASPGTEDIDRGKKFLEYEKGGVVEYWLFDPQRSEALFYRLNADGLYESQKVDALDNYQTPLLSGFVLHVPTLWQTPLPGPSSIFASVKEMLK
jgi:Uma2 family endonuclease